MLDPGQLSVRTSGSRNGAPVRLESSYHFLMGKAGHGAACVRVPWWGVTARDATAFPLSFQVFPRGA